MHGFRLEGFFGARENSAGRIGRGDDRSVDQKCGEQGRTMQRFAMRETMPSVICRSERGRMWMIT